VTTAATAYRIHAPIPEFIIRDQANAISAKIYDESGTLTAPDSGTVTIYDSGNTKVVDAAVVTIAADISTYTIAAADLPTTKGLSDGWRIEWDLVISADPYAFVRAAMLCRTDLYPTVISADLEARHQNLSRLIATGNDADDFISAAWEIILRMLLKAGRMPYLILSPFSLHDALVLLSLELIFRDGHTAAGDGKFAELADHYHEAFVQEWATISFDYDFDQDGQIEVDEKAAAESVVYLGGPGVETRRTTWP
tara:strand:- start:3032 stop:3790 length:759 start_codon:yes stop_codon:yes gene_type:complete